MTTAITRRTITGGVTAAHDFLAAGTACGIKKTPDALDLGIVLSGRPATVAATFTRNRAAAAPVQLCRERLRAGRARAVVANSGNANACTGEQGRRDAAAMARLTAARYGLDEGEVWVLSTGVIGVPLPMARVEQGIAQCAPSRDGGDDFARAILTTDTRTKSIALELDCAGVPVRLGGVAKGSGMIHPNMATMLSLLTTDAAVAPGFLQAALSRAVDRSFNLISVDGDSSTNDTVLLLANGAAGGPTIDAQHAGAALFEAALADACTYLAREVARDGEGARSLVEVRVRGAASEHDAHAIGRAVTLSPLVKTAVFGGDPNWGRVICAAGNAGVAFEPEQASLFLHDICLFRQGLGVPFDRARAADLLRQPEVTFTLDLGLGNGNAIAWSCDLSYDYVRINAEYTT
ncbi:MAG TPA: bifunctional glutamate N-acetyltransferase/amino-acid acetyltransferase ArgJ [Chloroflexota bacterium]|nr:bifunctional glutamate N-acetyltransferase/amino-acid acetyltransferase ArgJ [Chloroflexota bacterium]